MAELSHRLHRLSWIFHVAGKLKHFGLPLVAFFFLGKREDGWAVWAALPVAVFGTWSVLATWWYRYQVADGELLIRAGILDRTDRHIPLARIQHVSQRRVWLHRVLGVTELHLESATGGKPEAVMKVLSMAAAAELEATLRGAQSHSQLAAQPVQPAATNAQPQAQPQAELPAQPHAKPQAPPQADSQAAPEVLLHQLPLAEIVRLGLISNRGMLVAGALFGALQSHREMLKQVTQLTAVPRHWLASLVSERVDSGHWALAVLNAVLLVVLILVLLRMLSVGLAVFKYHGFTLEQHGQTLTLRQGLSTRVRAAARLPRLQRWVLEESWLHRLFGRCRLAVTVAGANVEHEDRTGPGMGFKELAPIATPQQAQALLKLCLPQLDWQALQWQPVHPGAALRRVVGIARYLVPAMFALLAAAVVDSWRVGPVTLLCVFAVVWAALVWYARAWARFAAFAHCGELLLWRSGVLTRRWVIVSGRRMQSLRLASSPLERSLGMATLQADIQGGSTGSRALNMHCIELADAQALRQHFWAYLHPSQAQTQQQGAASLPAATAAIAAG
jgi:putative membrane protein